MISVLQRIAEQPRTIDGRHVTPVAWDCNCLEEVCGACTMVINGRVRQACSALVHKLLEEQPGEIEVRPMSKFPVTRDPLVDRGRLFRALKKVKAWIPADGYYDLGPGPLQSRDCPGGGLSTQPVHELRLLSGSVSSVHQGRIDAATGRIEARSSSSGRNASTITRSWDRMPSARRCFSTRIPTGKMNAGRTAGSPHGAGRHSGLWECTELRRRLSQADPAHHVDRQGGSRHDAPHVEALV